MKKIWHDKAWDDYLDWQSKDKKTLKRINVLLKYIEENTLEIAQCGTHYGDH